MDEIPDHPSPKEAILVVVPKLQNYQPYLPSKQIKVMLKIILNKLTPRVKQTIEEHLGDQI